MLRLLLLQLLGRCRLRLLWRALHMDAPAPARLKYGPSKLLLSALLTAPPIVVKASSSILSIMIISLLLWRESAA